MAEEGLPLLNLFEAEDVAGGTRHFVAFIDTVRAGASGIDPRAIVGDFTPGPGGDFDAQTFRINPEFARALADYMDQVVAPTPAVSRDAAEQPGGWLYVVDPRVEDDPDDPESDPDASDILGCFAVDDAGQVAPKSFQYNANHRIFSEESGVTGLLLDRGFYDWLHPAPPPRRTLG